MLRCTRIIKTYNVNDNVDDDEEKKKQTEKKVDRKKKKLTDENKKYLQSLGYMVKK
jgi:hypothetical protein